MSAAMIRRNPNDVEAKGAGAPTLTTYTIECTPPDGERRTLRVRGASENQAIMGAYDYLARQYDGAGDVHEDTLTPLTGEPAAIDGNHA